MISKEQFEAHVRAEAMVKCPSPLPLPDDESRGELIDYFHELGKHEAYIDTRMEHEWPLVEAINRLSQQANLCDFRDPLGHELKMNAAYLDIQVLRSPYTNHDTQNI